MFTQKQTKLFDTQKSASNLSKGSTVANTPLFVQKAMRKSVETVSGNNAKKLSSTLDPFVDQFGKMGSFKTPRSFDEVSKDCEILWAEDPLNTVKFSAFLRTIPRKVQLFDGSITTEPQKGAELKHEPIMRMIWLSQKAPDVFWKNVGLFVSLGSWHDIFTMLQYDLVYNGWENRKLNWKSFGNLILSALENKNSCDLVKKYLPQIKARSACKTVEAQANCLIAKWICALIFGNKENSFNYKKYRQLKTSGSAHDWQKLISQRQFDKIEFDKIHGRALNLLVRSKFLKNQNLSDKYAKWVGDPTTSVKYTGFVHELFSKIPGNLVSMEKSIQDTINKQFYTLVEKAKSEKQENSCNWIVVRDTSNSMSVLATGTKQSCGDVGKALAIYFSEFLKGRFANSWIEFNSSAKMQQWKGQTPLEKWCNDRSRYIGGTNFQSVIDLFVDLKKEGIDESEFPTGILCISDSEFNPAQLGKTNVEVAREKLRNGGFSEDFANKFQIVLWNLQSSYYGKGTGEKFETTANESGTYYFSGFSGSIISFLEGKQIQTPRQVFDAAMSQEILERITL